jgi:hypothetical protein
VLAEEATILSIVTFHIEPRFSGFCHYTTTGHTSQPPPPYDFRRIHRREMLISTHIIIAVTGALPQYLFRSYEVVCGKQT